MFCSPFTVTVLLFCSVARLTFVTVVPNTVYMQIALLAFYVNLFVNSNFWKILWFFVFFVDFVVVLLLDEIVFFEYAYAPLKSVYLGNWTTFHTWMFWQDFVPILLIVVPSKSLFRIYLQSCVTSAVMYLLERYWRAGECSK